MGAREPCCFTIRTPPFHDAFNMKSARVVVSLGEKQNELWDKIFDAFGGIVQEPREKEEISNRVRIIK